MKESTFIPKPFNHESEHAAIFSIVKRYRERVLYKSLFLAASFIILITTMLVAISIGTIEIPLGKVITAVFAYFLPTGNQLDENIINIIGNIRLPRVLTGMVVGMGLGVSGAVMQTVLRNPMASPFTLGVAAGAGLGAALAIICSIGFFGLTGKYMIVLNAFIFSIVVSLIILGIATLRGNTPHSLILAGIAIMFFCHALITLITYFSDVYATREIMFWMVGSLGKADWNGFMVMFVTFLCVFPYLLFKANDLNRMAMGDEVAKSLGVAIKQTRIYLMLALSLLVATIVSFTGTIGFVGLVVPHIVRMMIGSDNRFVIPASALIGGILLVSADAFALNAFKPVVLPVGVVTSFIGSPLFVYLILRRRREIM